MKKRKMSALQRKYFGKRHSSRKVSPMAKRSYRRYTGRISRRSGGGGGRGIFSGLLAPIVGGMADAIINPRSPINGIGSAATGYLLKDQIIKEIGLYQVGQSIATFIPFLGAQSGGIASQV